MEPLFMLKSDPGHEARVFGLRPEMVLALLAAFTILVIQMGKQLVLTSCMDGKHRRGSLHYQGFAFDVRTRHLSDEEVVRFVSLMVQSVGHDFDVVRESTHVHVEFQPKLSYTGD